MNSANDQNGCALLVLWCNSYQWFTHNDVIVIYATFGTQWYLKKNEKGAAFLLFCTFILGDRWVVYLVGSCNQTEISL